MSPEQIQQLMEIYQNTPVYRRDLRQSLDDAIRLGIKHFFEEQNPAALNAEEHDLAQTGQKILAIRKIRERTGLGLKEAKELLEREYP